MTFFSYGGRHYLRSDADRLSKEISSGVLVHVHLHFVLLPLQDWWQFWLKLMMKNMNNIAQNCNLRSFYRHLLILLLALIEIRMSRISIFSLSWLNNLHLGFIKKEKTWDDRRLFLSFSVKWCLRANASYSPSATFAACRRHAELRLWTTRLS